MKINSKAMNGGKIPDRFGKRGKEINAYGIPTRSVPLEILEPPDGTESFALVLEDRDAVPVCGFSWIHWTAVNITDRYIKENDSIEAKDYVQGVNSWYGDYGEEGAKGYGGMAPPDRPHTYELHVYALDCRLPLKDGFFVDELYEAMEGHVLDKETVTGRYSN